MSGFEALLRWQHPVRGMVSPAEFIPLAEADRRHPSIGAWCCATACRRPPSGRTTSPHRGQPVAGPVPQRRAGVRTSRSAAGRRGLRPDRLELEITEARADQDDATGADHRCTDLKKLGVLDLDGRFRHRLLVAELSAQVSVRQDQDRSARSSVVSQEADNVAIVRAVIDLGEALGMSVIAEGVETGEQLAILQPEGCWNVQGYYFSRPAPRRTAPWS